MSSDERSVDVSRPFIEIVWRISRVQQAREFVIVKSRFHRRVVFDILSELQMFHNGIFHMEDVFIDTFVFIAHGLLPLFWWYHEKPCSKAVFLSSSES